MRTQFFTSSHFWFAGDYPPLKVGDTVDVDGRIVRISKVWEGVEGADEQRVETTTDPKMRSISCFECHHSPGKMPKCNCPCHAKEVVQFSSVWHRVTSDHPDVGARVIIWHPAYGEMVAHRGQEGFFEAHYGRVVAVETPVIWWSELPGRPPGEEEPSRSAFLKAINQR